MGWLIGRMLLCLILAFGLGLLLGWLLGRLGWRRRVEEVEESGRRLLEALEAQLAECEERRGQAAGVIAERDALLGRIASKDEELARLRDDLEAAARQTAEPMKTPTQAMAAVSLDSTAVVAGAGVMAAAEPPASGTESSPDPDDLKKIEGIGPKIEELLNADGILTWSQLAEAATDRLRGILEAAGPRYRIHDPGTWPQQARLAAEGRWDELEALQDELDGGKAPG